jgi:hypothetical protein
VRAIGTDGFAGDLFLNLAVERKLPLDPEQAGVIVDDLTRTLESVEFLLWSESRPRAESAADWLAGGSPGPTSAWHLERLAAAKRELPKYIEAFRMIRDQ